MNQENVEDGNGSKLGSIKSSWRTSFLLNLDNSEVLKAKQRIWKQQEFEVKDPSDNLIGKVVREELWSRSSEISMKDKNGNEVLRGRLPHTKNTPFEIYGTENNVVAELTSKTGHSLDSFRGEQIWNLHIRELSFDRILLLGFFLATFNLNHDMTSIEGAGGG